MWSVIYNFLNTLWGYPMLVLLVGGGIYYGIRTKFFQIRCLPLIFRKTFGELFKTKQERKAEQTEGTLTPFQALSTVLAGTVGAGNVANVGHAFYMIFSYAFKPISAVGGFAGSTVIMTKGGFRGIFSNEAGEGTAATVHASAKTDHPIHQGFYGVVEVFIDTIVVCTLTGLAIFCTGNIWTSGDTGVYLTFSAFRQAFGNIGAAIVGISVFLFAYSSYLGFFVEFRTSLEYIFNEKKAGCLKWIFFIPPVISCVLPVSFVWDLTDMVVGFIFIPNMIAVLLLSPQVLIMLKEYTAKCKAEKTVLKRGK